MNEGRCVRICAPLLKEQRPRESSSRIFSVARNAVMMKNALRWSSGPWVRAACSLELHKHSLVKMREKHVAFLSGLSV